MVSISVPDLDNKSSDSDPSNAKKEGSDQFEDSSPKKLSSSGRGGSGRGRASTSGFGSDDKNELVLNSMQSMKIQSDEAEAVQSPLNAPAPVREVAKKASPARADPQTNEQDEETVTKHGKNGQKFDSMTNCIMIKCDKNFGVYEYEVRFQPEVDNMRLRGKYLSQLVDVLGNVRTFDGVTLYLPIQLDQITDLETPSLDGGETIKIKIIFRRQKRMSECVHLYNVLFERIMGILQYQRVGRKSFDPTAPKIIQHHKLEGTKLKTFV
jgi:hypothetical protein